MFTFLMLVITPNSKYKSKKWILYPDMSGISSFTFVGAADAEIS